MISFAEKKSPPTGVGSAVKLEYQYKWWLTRPGVPADESEELHHGFYSQRDGHFDHLAFMNELGREGWELVSDTVVKSGINMHTVGWGTTSEPLHRTFLFKRPVE